MTLIDYFGVRYDRMFVNEVLTPVSQRPNRELDTVWLTTGREGVGKSSASFQFAYFIAQSWKVPFNENHVFFSSDELLEAASKTTGQVYILDEAILNAASSSHASAEYKKLKKCLVVMRKRKHFIILNIPRLEDIGNYIAYRAHAQVNVFLDKDGRRGNFVVYSQDVILPNYYEAKKTHRDRFQNYAMAGSFSHDKVPGFDYDKYEECKDEMIKQVLAEDESPRERRDHSYDELLAHHYTLKVKIHAYLKGKHEKSLNGFAEFLGIQANAISQWKHLTKKISSLSPNSDDSLEETPSGRPMINNIDTLKGTEPIKLPNRLNFELSKKPIDAGSVLLVDTGHTIESDVASEEIRRVREDSEGSND